MAFAITPSLQRYAVSVAVPTSVASPSLTLSKATAMSPLDLQGSSTTCYEGPLHMPGVTRFYEWVGEEVRTHGVKSDIQDSATVLSWVPDSLGTCWQAIR